MTTGVTNQNKGQKENMSRYNNYDTRDCVYNFCKDFILEHGYAPSVREIADAVGLKSSSSAFYHIQKLMEEGLLVKAEREGVSRAFTLAGYEVKREKDNKGNAESGKRTKEEVIRTTEAIDGHYVPLGIYRNALNKCIEKLGSIEDTEEVILKYSGKTAQEVLEDYAEQLTKSYMEKYYHLSIEVCDCDGTEKQMKWKDASDFLDYCKELSTNELHNNIIFMVIGKKKYTKNMLEKKSIKTVQDLRDWCKSLPSSIAGKKYLEYIAAEKDASILQKKNGNSYFIMKKNDAYFLALCRDNEKVFLDKDKYVVQGYGIAGVVNAHGIIRF